MNIKDKFCQVIDQLVLELEDDVEFQEAIKYIDEVARKKNTSFYDLLLTLYTDNEIQKAINKWSEIDKYNQNQVKI